jgi:hypothetical protein
MKRLISIAVFGLALMSLLSGCDHSQPSPSQARGSYITMAMESPGESWALSLFPKTAGTERCVFHAGPPPGIWVPSMCTTRVIVRSNTEATVCFLQRWNARRFHADSGRRSRLNHTWEVTVSRRESGDHVVGSRSYGDFPPQLVRQSPLDTTPNLAPPRAGGGDTHPPLGV